jgi:hypothetical protein
LSLETQWVNLMDELQHHTLEDYEAGLLALPITHLFLINIDSIWRQLSTVKRMKTFISDSCGFRGLPAWLEKLNLGDLSPALQ